MEYKILSVSAYSRVSGKKQTCNYLDLNITKHIDVMHRLHYAYSIPHLPIVDKTYPDYSLAGENCISFYYDSSKYGPLFRQQDIHRFSFTIEEVGDNVIISYNKANKATRILILNGYTIVELILDCHIDSIITPKILGYIKSIGQNLVCSQ